MVPSSRHNHASIQFYRSHYFHECVLGSSSSTDSHWTDLSNHGDCHSNCIDQEIQTATQIITVRMWPLLFVCRKGFKSRGLIIIDTQGLNLFVPKENRVGEFPPPSYTRQTSQKKHPLKNSSTYPSLAVAIPLPNEWEFGVCTRMVTMWGDVVVDSAGTLI